jgi:hypothetical protein
MSDKYFDFVARSRNLTIKAKIRGLDHKGACELIGAFYRADAIIAQANGARMRARAILAATTVVSIGLGLGVLV